METNPTQPVPSAAAMQCAEQLEDKGFSIYIGAFDKNGIARLIDQAIATAVEEATMELVEQNRNLRTQWLEAKLLIGGIVSQLGGELRVNDSTMMALDHEADLVEFRDEANKQYVLQVHRAHRTGR